MGWMSFKDYIIGMSMELVLCVVCMVELKDLI